MSDVASAEAVASSDRVKFFFTLSTVAGTAPQAAIRSAPPYQLVVDQLSAPPPYSPVIARTTTPRAPPPYAAPPPPPYTALPPPDHLRPFPALADTRSSDGGLIRGLKPAHLRVPSVNTDSNPMTPSLGGDGSEGLRSSETFLATTLQQYWSAFTMMHADDRWSRAGAQVSIGCSKTLGRDFDNAVGSTPIQMFPHGAVVKIKFSQPDQGFAQLDMLSVWKKLAGVFMCSHSLEGHSPPINSTLTLPFADHVTIISLNAPCDISIWLRTIPAICNDYIELEENFINFARKAFPNENFTTSFATTQSCVEYEAQRLRKRASMETQRTLSSSLSPGDTRASQGNQPTVPVSPGSDARHTSATAHQLSHVHNHYRSLSGVGSIPSPINSPHSFNLVHQHQHHHQRFPSIHGTPPRTTPVPMDPPIDPPMELVCTPTVQTQRLHRHDPYRVSYDEAASVASPVREAPPVDTFYPVYYPAVGFVEPFLYRIPVTTQGFETRSPEASGGIQQGEQNAIKKTRRGVRGGKHRPRKRLEKAKTNAPSDAGNGSASLCSALLNAASAGAKDASQCAEGNDDDDTGSVVVHDDDDASDDEADQEQHEI